MAAVYLFGQDTADPRPYSLRERAALVLMSAILLALPFCGHGWKVELPGVWGGDEPHYLIMLSSLIEDGDLDLGNNYRAARAGSLDAGRHWAGEPLEHQTTWFRDGRRISWAAIHTRDSSAVDRDGFPIRPSEASEMAGAIERPIHPPGLAWLLAPLVWPVRLTPWAEPLAMMLIALSVIVAMLVFHATIRPWASAPLALGVTASTFLASPISKYARSFFAEGPLTLLAVGALYFTIRRPNGWLAGLLLAIGAQLKPPFLILAVPLGVLLVRRSKRGALGGALLCVIAVAVVLASNKALYGAATRGPQDFEWGHPVEGLIGLLLDPRQGLFCLAPISAAAVIGWPWFWRRHGDVAPVLLATFGLYDVLMASWSDWRGGSCWGPRLIVPVIPFLMVGLLGLRDAPRWLQRICLVVGIVSVVLGIRYAAGR